MTRAFWDFVGRYLPLRYVSRFWIWQSTHLMCASMLSCESSDKKAMQFLRFCFQYRPYAKFFVLDLTCWIRRDRLMRNRKCKQKKSCMTASKRPTEKIWWFLLPSNQSLSIWLKASLNRYREKLGIETKIDAQHRGMEIKNIFGLRQNKAFVSSFVYDRCEQITMNSYL